MLGELPLALPPLDEQRRIGALLSALDDEAEALESAAAEVVVLRAAATTLFVPDLPGQHDSG